VAPDGRSLCAGCADDERTLVCDGGHFMIAPRIGRETEED